MRTLKDHTLLYDTECPLCKVYTSGFVKAKMLDQNGRQPFSKLKDDNLLYVDVQRASNEIALVDTKSKTVVYGIDSILKVIGNSYPRIQRLGKVTSIYAILKLMYAFISYNRKVIMPSERKMHTIECKPDFSVRYRLLYLLFAVMITMFILYHFSGLVSELPKATMVREFILVVGQLIFQGLFFLRKDMKTYLNYCGNVMTVSLIGSLGLLQIIILNGLIPWTNLMILLSSLGVVGMMFFEHRRRIKLLELPYYLSYTWILYRVLVLAFILNLL